MKESSLCENSSKGADCSTHMVLQDGLPGLCSAIEKMTSGSNGTHSNNSTDDSCMDLVYEHDAMVLLQHLRPKTFITSPVSTHAVSEPHGNSPAPASTLVSTPPLGPIERLQQKKVGAMPNKKRRRDGVSPLSNTGTLPSFVVSASSGIDDNSSSGTIAASSRSRNAQSVLLSESPRYLPRDALGCGSKVDGRLIPDNSSSGFSSGIAIGQLLEQFSNHLGFSREHSDESAEETCTVSYGGLSIPAVTNSLFSQSGGVAGPMSQMDERKLKAQLAAAFSWRSPAGMERDGEEDDDSAKMSWRARTPADDPSDPDDPLGIKDMLRYIDPGRRWVFQKAVTGRVAGDSGDKLYDDDSDNGSAYAIEDDEEEEEEEDDDRSFYGEDPDDLKKNKMDTLSLSTMRELVACWGIQFDKDEDKEVYGASIIEHFRFLAFTFVSVVSDFFETQTSSSTSSFTCDGGTNNNNNKSSSNNNGNKRLQNGSLVGVSVDGVVSDLVVPKGEERTERVRRTLLSLRDDILRLNSDHLRYFANIFAFTDRNCTSEEIFKAISALGVLTFFQPLPTPLLEKVCHELSIPTNDKLTELVDTNQLPELLAEKISHYFYPLGQSIPSITKLKFMPTMQIHEHAPGRHTCTIDNANLMKVLKLQRYVSNHFSCNKIRWHAVLTVVKEQISFCVWHRHSETIKAHMVIRTQDPKKKRKGNNNNNNNTPDSPHNQEITLKETSALYLECEVDAAPGELVGFENFVSLPDALRSTTTSQVGYRLYNSSEDRLVFQCSMDLMHIDGSPFIDEGKKKSSGSHQNGKTTSTKRVGDQNADHSNATEQTTALEEEEKRQKEWEKAVSKLGKNEIQGRESITQSWINSTRQLMNEHCKAYQKVLQKKKERERKLLLAKVGPNPQLQKELDLLLQTVTTNRAQVAELTKKKVKDEKAVQRLQAQIEEGKREIELLQELLRSRIQMISKLEAETANYFAKAKEREEAKRRKQQEWTPALSIPHLSTTRHETLAINDLQSFWSPSYANGINLRDLVSEMTPIDPSPQCSPESLPAAAPGLNPMTLAAACSDDSGTCILLPRSAAVSSGGTFSSLLPPSSGDVIGTDLTSWAPLTQSTGFADIRGSNNINTIGRYDSLATAFSTHLPILQTDATHISGMDIMGGGSPVEQSTGFTVTAPFTTANTITRFTLDVNARPFTPTSMVGGKTSSSTVSHSNYTATAGVATVAHRSPTTTTSPMTVMSSKGTTIGTGLFPERPRYTSVSTPVSTGITTTTTTSSSPRVFSTGPIQNAASLFGLPGPSSGVGTPPKQVGGRLSLNFTTAPWN